MAKKINVKGVIIPNDYKWIYDWFEIENTAPRDIENVLPNDGSPIELVINSPGGDVYSGSEIYTLLKDYHGKKTGKIVGIAASAASVIAMAADNLQISPTAQIMIHNVSSYGGGDYRDFQHEANVLKNWNKSIAAAYQLKSGKTYDQLLSMMDAETWLNAEQALELKLVDGIMFQNNAPQLVAGMQDGMLPSSIIEKMRNMKAQIHTQSEPMVNNQINNQIEFEKAKLKLNFLRGKNLC